MTLPIAGTFVIKRGDTHDTLIYQCRRVDVDTGALVPVDLTTAAAVNFKMRHNPDDQTGLVINKPGVLGSALSPARPVAQGWVGYPWDAMAPVGDTAVGGTFDAEFEVTWADGTRETFPTTGDTSDEFITVIITADLDDVVIPGATVPGSPVNIVATGGNGFATITFNPPASNGGTPIISYSVTATDLTTPGHGGQLQTGLSSPIVVDGLTNGDSYTFKVTAVNVVGGGAPSAASNAVTPAAPVTVPSEPLNAQATAGDGQASITFSAPLSNGGSAITSYRVTAVDITLAGRGGQHQDGSSSPIVVTGLTDNDEYRFTVHAVNAIGSSSESNPSNSVVPHAPISGGPVATFSYTQPSSSTVLLDAAGSNGTLTWEVDGVASTVHTTTLQIGPLKVGSHHVKLTAVANAATTISERDIDVAWVGRPLSDAQHDATNGFPGSGLTLPQWSSLPAIGPWRNKNVLNEAEQVPPGDGISRITAYSDMNVLGKNNHISLLTKYGDLPGTSGGFRSAMEMTNNYDATAAGFPFPVSGTLDVTGEGGGDGHSGSVRFYRVEIMLPSTNPNPLLYQNNFFELHGVSGTAAPLRFQTNGAGTQLMWVFSAMQNGVAGPNKNWDMRNIQWDTWYNYVVEVLLDLDPTKGYIRVYRDGAALTSATPSRVPAGTGSDGKFFAATQQTDANGDVVLMAVDCQNYRTKVGMPSNYPDAIVHYRNIVIGPTMASVTI